MPVLCDGFINTISSGYHELDNPRKLTPAYKNAVEYKPNGIREDKPVGVKDKGTQKRLEKSHTYCTIS